MYVQVRMLLAEGAQRDAAASNGCTALWVAAKMGHLDVVHVLLRVGGCGVGGCKDM
jgi:hypothetical protein